MTEQQDMDRLRSILKLFEGTHNFRAFRGQLEQNAKKRKREFDTVRTMYRVELIKEEEETEEGGRLDDCYFLGEEGENYRIDFLLQGALYKMVRNMVRTVMECWLGRMSERLLVDLLSQNVDGGNDNDNDIDNGNESAEGDGRERQLLFQRKEIIGLWK